MPVEIRELHIKINVNEQTQDNNNITSGTENNRQETRKKEDALVAECVAQTLNILADEKER
jgi:hypothetical protein